MAIGPLSKHVGHHVCLLVGHLVHLHVGHHVHLHVGRHVNHRVGHHNVISRLCEVSGTLTEWKSESVMDLRTDRLTEVGLGARDTCMSKNHLLWIWSSPEGLPETRNCVKKMNKLMRV